MNRKIIALVLLFCLVFTCGAEAAKKKRRSSASSASSSQSDSVLPRRGDIAVVVEGDDDQHVRIAETKIIDSLIKHGYRVVDEKKMRAAKAAAVRAQAYRLAMQGNYDAIFKLNASYSCAATVIARVQAGQAIQNMLGLYSGSASISLLAVTSRGTKLGGRTSYSKGVGMSEYEAFMKCIETAVEDGMKQMY
ncbi:MAG: hypothetical protein IJG51_03310 [Synergistaceae bacterium]|nr:hypothetical protein [Synergistaceae bacterium]MBQ3397899.1 hypothetical protein [Synergistaceae bacterium]MBQ4402499.1 hypothetical protein [Synergistaceae bacterium]MBQ6001802.1 hypothetical protein [Synergistaceae bacterium]MBQ6417869.1 hypothetical protein [Synergistaceae bacterium]